MAATILSSGGHRPPHQARSFPDLPDAERAATLLGQLATAPCPFSPIKPDLPLALYGAGNLGLLACEFLTAVGHGYHMVIDRNAQLLAQEPCWSGVSLVHPDGVPAAAKRGLRLAVSIVTSPYVPLERSLLALGFEDVVPFYDLAESFRDRHPLSNGWLAAPLPVLDQKKTTEVLTLWDDDVSRAHHLQFLAWRRLREEWTFDAAPIPACKRFFIAEIVDVLNSNESLLDCGAHYGSVIETFVKQTKGRFRQITAVEPDPSNRALLENNLQRWLPGDPRIAVYDCVLADEERAALFHEGLGYASQLSSTGNVAGYYTAVRCAGTLSHIFEASSRRRRTCRFKRSPANAAVESAHCRSHRLSQCRRYLGNAALVDADPARLSIPVPRPRMVRYGRGGLCHPAGASSLRFRAWKFDLECLCAKSVFLKPVFRLHIQFKSLGSLIPSRR